MTKTTRVLGVDACRAGWVGVAWDGDGATALAAQDIGSLVAAAELGGRVSVVAIDIPIGLPDTGRRQADVLAKLEIGRLRSSVFMTPVRPALEADDHPSAVVLNRELAGEGVSIQAFGLRSKVFEVERFVRSPACEDRTVLEVHPEVVFARMNGAPLTDRKKTWAGAETRRALLAERGLVLSGAGGLSGVDVGVDDVLDAAATAWTARRHTRGQSEALPATPEIFSDGWPAAIWV
ncbi:DUF429 domain-containing protein [Sanguibacter inulinus]|uniref:DUF429 domain-containing protein n=1 Tax=Sanguibacter inulinus TaxID=60922 RepID=A0A853EU13_9MICO|nr:DUF429 domain-containing protein [Sanguibacter inulinus]MBF0721223.1 DUF429 domain-containing protein [Sanguibacter inulinus]NYS92368.1 DUF429 domain-containing protein [Sanguibacter inulinus]